MSRAYSRSRNGGRVTPPGSGRFGAAAWWWAGLALAPFPACAAAVWLVDTARAAMILDALLLYAAIGLACVGAFHWGLSLASGTGGPAGPAWAAVLALAAWLSGQLVAPLALCLLAAGHAGAFLLDRNAGRRGLLPPRYVLLRRWSVMVMLGAFAVLLFRA